MLKVLNAYAGIGGNRKKWKDVKVTAVENNKEIADIYAEYFPEDEVIVDDAHEYILRHYKEFNFIWSSPPCQTHSRFRFMCTKMENGEHRKRETKYIDFQLWQEIIFLRHYAECKWVVENVVPYYEPLIHPTVELQRHLFWSNFKIQNTNLIENSKLDIKSSKVKSEHFDLSNFKIKHRKDQILNNCVNPDLGLYILEQAQGIIRQEKIGSGQQRLL